MESSNNYKSQCGEDRILEDIFNRIGTTNKVAIELGAWNGEHFSNTFYFWTQGWSRILAESDEERLRGLYGKFERTQVFGKVVNIDAMLDFFKAPLEPDLLSIDIDGDDYYLWEDMVRYRPRVVVIEYNQTVPDGARVVQKRGGNFGASARAMWDLGLKKGYLCVSITTTNMIFVYDDWRERGLNKWPENVGACHPEIPCEWQSSIITGYNGKSYMIGKLAHNDNQGGKHEELISDVPLTPITIKL